MHGAVAVITLDNPPVNGLGHEIRSELVAGIDRALTDAEKRAIEAEVRFIVREDQPVSIEWMMSEASSLPGSAATGSPASSLRTISR